MFEKGAGTTDQSLIATGRSLVVENNHGYTGPAATQGGAHHHARARARGPRRPAAGAARSWHSDERAPTVVPKLSAAHRARLHVHEGPARGPGDDGWYLTAIDFAHRQDRVQAARRRGLGYNNNYAPVTLGPDGTAYVGMLGGIVALADAAPPPARGGGGGPPPRLAAAALPRAPGEAGRQGRGARGCAASGSTSAANPGEAGPQAAVHRAGVRRPRQGSCARILRKDGTRVKRVGHRRR